MEEEEIDNPENDGVLVTEEEKRLAAEGTSQFLRFQDKNGDKLPDVCDVEIVPAENICRDCVPNPLAISKDWRKSNQNNPFLNEKICKYQITYRTDESTTGFVEGMTTSQSDQALQDIYAKYAERAATDLLKGFQKETSTDSITRVLTALEYTDYDLEANNTSKLKLLYSIDFSKFASLPAEIVEDDDSDADDSDIEFSYESSDMVTKQIRVRKGLNLYGRYAKVARAVEGKNIRFTESNKIFTLEDYGDSALFTQKSPIGDIVRELESWLNGRGYQIPGVNGGGFFRGFGDNKVIKIDFIVTSNYKLRKLKIYTEGCGTGRPDIAYGTKFLTALNSTEGWKDPTAVAYFAKMKEIESAVSARVPVPFEEFVVKFTYPEVFIEGPAEPRNAADPARTIDSCIQDALANDFKELGQDILDEVFSLADAIAYKFHKNLCQTQPSEVDEEALLQGLNIGAGPGPTSNIYGLAKMQAFDTITTEDSAFAQLCFRMISMGASGTECGLSPIQQLDQMYAEGLDRIAVCGLMDLLLEALQCLFKGLPLEEALASIVRSALQVMGVTQIGELFVGLPPEKQLELERLVNEKLESGDIFKNGSPGQATSDVIAGRQNAPDANIVKNFKNKKPWEDDKFVEQQENNKRADNYGNMNPSRSPNYSPREESDRRTIGQKLQAPTGDGTEINNFILNAYVEAILEVYQDNFLELIDILNKFPGAQLIASIIAFLDCPTPPLFNPGFDDFFKSLQLPFCRNTKPITFPKWENPFLYIPKLTDILAGIFEALKRLVMCIIMRVLVLVLSKVCEIIGDAICKALEVFGAIGAGLLTGNANVREIMRETICGPDATDEQIDNTVLELMENFGVGGAAFADPERTQSFFGDFINSLNRQEALTMFLEGPSRGQIEILDGLLNTEYQDFRNALPNKNSIERMLLNVKAIVPIETINEIRESLNLGSDDLSLPVNPTLCATPEDLANFENARCDILAGRMSPEQCVEQNRKARDIALENISDINKVLNEGISSVLENSMPPIFSDPGCDNGLLPFEPEEAIKTATGALKSNMESLQIAYTDDMLGNGGFFGSDDDWGMINMVLSDTFANPYTAHQRKVYNTNRFVDFYIPNDAEMDANTLSVAPYKRQRGAYPYYVAEWLKYQYKAEYGAQDLNISLTTGGFKGTNDIQEAEVYRKSFEELGFDGLFDTDVNVTEIQDYGYNIKLDVKFEDERVNITKEARKKTSDITLAFKDNSKGYRTNADGTSGRSDFAYGFDLKAYYSDIVELDNGISTGYFNIPNDNVRVKIMEYVNTNAKSISSIEEKLNKGEDRDTSEDEAADAGATILEYDKYEFFAVDDTLDRLSIEETNFPLLLQSFVDGRKLYSPQVYALSDITGIGVENCNTIYNTFNSKIYSQIRDDVGNNEDVWKYGAQFDGLTTEDFDYGIKLTQAYQPYNSSYSVGEFVPYEEFRVRDIDDEGEETSSSPRKLNNQDSLLGISRNQYDNPKNPKVIYLDPTQFGQNYMSPSLYVKPTKNKGWLGAINLMFPEYTPCKPHSTNLIGFDDIQNRIDEVYSRIPEDKRLKTDPDCVFEAPFNRILSRPSRAGLEAVITALIRIYASTHFIKSLPVFGTFEPKFPENYSNIYAAYIIENMEEACINAGNNFLSPFKDNEFWYAFLEQSVQVYSRRLDDDLDDSITPDSVPSSVKEAIEKINNLQDRYDQPSPKEFRKAPSQEKSNFQTLKGYREEKILEAVREVEEEAKLILLELVKEQLSYISELFHKNLKEAQLSTEKQVVNVDYYFLEQFANGAGDLNISSAVEFVETALDSDSPIGTEDENGRLYTAGNEMALLNGTPYSGYFHIHADENGNEIYMAGEQHVQETHETLVPFAKNIKIQGKNIVDELIDIGDLADDTVGSTKQFYVRKYVLLDGHETSVSAAEAEIRGKATGKISDYYPGSMTLTRNDAGMAVGVEGELGVRHGIEFGINNSGNKKVISKVEIDALDLEVIEFSGAKANSKLLLCLLDNLRDDNNFRMTVDYIFSMKKALSMFAIYTDLAFMPSIGEYTTGIDGIFKDEADKPGVSVSDDFSTIEWQAGWAHESERNKLFASPFFRKWDEWDQVLLRKSVRRAKKIFRPYYRKRKFEVEDPDGMGAGEQYLNNVKERFKMRPGGMAIPWFKRKKLKPNPLNSKGQLCKKRN